MKILKNIFVGFLVSFVGSIPLGYLNIIGFEVYSKSGIQSLVLYLLGVISIEAIVIYTTLLFANRLMANKKLIKFIEVFSILFMLLLACSFYFKDNSGSSSANHLSKFTIYPPFFIGIISSSLNFMQVPFWLGWNVYVVNEKYIALGKKLNLIYLAGTLIGSFCGILTVVLLLNLVTEGTTIISKYLLSHIIPLFFLGLATFQAYKFYIKYYSRK